MKEIGSTEVLVKRSTRATSTLATSPHDVGSFAHPHRGGAPGKVTSPQWLNLSQDGPNSNTRAVVSPRPDSKRVPLPSSYRGNSCPDPASIFLKRVGPAPKFRGSHMHRRRPRPPLALPTVSKHSPAPPKFVHHTTRWPRVTSMPPLLPLPPLLPPLPTSATTLAPAGARGS